jgi:Flp pilus assembly pilin Flp
LGEVEARFPADDQTMRREDGQTMAEYSVTLGVIVVGILLTMGFLSDQVRLSILRVADLIHF